MIRKYRIAIMFLIISLAFAMFSLPNSGALSWGSLEREITATVAADNSGVLKLEGIDGKMAVDLTNKFNSIGSITNQTKQKLHITLDINPRFIFANNKNIKLEIMVDNLIREFSYLNNHSQQIILQLEPGQNIELQASLSNNSNVLITIAFDLTVRDEAGAITLTLQDTDQNPRRLICY